MQGRNSAHEHALLLHHCHGARCCHPLRPAPDEQRQDRRPGQCHCRRVHGPGYCHHHAPRRFLWFRQPLDRHCRGHGLRTLPLQQGQDDPDAAARGLSPRLRRRRRRPGGTHHAGGCGSGVGLPPHRRLPGPLLGHDHHCRFLRGRGQAAPGAAAAAHRAAQSQRHRQLPAGPDAGGPLHLQYRPRFSALAHDWTHVRHRRALRHRVHPARGRGGHAHHHFPAQLHGRHLLRHRGLCRGRPAAHRRGRHHRLGGLHAHARHVQGHEPAAHAHPAGRVLGGRQEARRRPGRFRACGANAARRACRVRRFRRGRHR